MHVGYRYSLIRAFVSPHNIFRSWFCFGLNGPTIEGPPRQLNGRHGNMAWSPELSNIKNPTTPLPIILSTPQPAIEQSKGALMQYVEGHHRLE
jgi:hypothetical protein